MLPKSRWPESCHHVQLSAKPTWIKETFAVNFAWSLTWLAGKPRAESRAHRRRATAFWQKNSSYLSKEGKWRKKKDAEKLLWPVPARLCPQPSIPPLSAGVKSRKLLLYYSECCGPPHHHPTPQPTPPTSPPSALCMCGWLQALSLFFPSVHMHIQGIAARIFKGTGAFTKWGGQHCPTGKNTPDSGPTCTIIPAKGNNHLNVGIFLWYSSLHPSIPISATCQ